MTPPKVTTITNTEHDAFVDNLFALRQTIILLEDTRDTVIRQAREAGVPWQSIAVALGISKQGAQQRYGPKIPDPHQMTLDGE